MVGEYFHAGLGHVSAPRSCSVVGIGGMAGAFTGATMAVIVGYILQVTGAITEFRSSSAGRLT